ncbi:MAG: hypothetical protein WBA65_04890 [Rhodanobacter sp.]|jgi:hypothetical protein
MSAQLSTLDPFAVVEVVRAPGVKGIPPGAGQDDADPDWQPL